MSNEVVLKTIKANDEAVKAEQQKINKLKEIRTELIKAYKLMCRKCAKEFRLSEYDFIQRYSVDADSDWRPYKFKNCILQCPDCKNRNNIPEELTEIFKESEYRVFKTIIEEADDRWY